MKAGLDPKRYTLRTVPGLLAKSDAWKDYDAGERPSPRRRGGSERFDAPASATSTTSFQALVPGIPGFSSREHHEAGANLAATTSAEPWPLGTSPRVTVKKLKYAAGA